MKKVLFTGGTGYLGSRIINRLKEQHRICCITLPDDPKICHHNFVNEVSYITIGDIYYETKIKEFAPDVVVHVACAYENRDSHPSELYGANLIFPLELINICAKIGVKTWINTDTALPDSVSMYSLSKKQFVEWANVFSKKYEMNVVNLQLEHFYGEGVSETQFISFIINKLKQNEDINLTDGLQRRDFVYVDDIVSVYNFFIDKVVSGVINVPVGTGVSPTIREVVEYLKIIIGSSSQLNFGAIPRRENEFESECDTRILQSMGIDNFVYWKDGMKLMV